MFFPANHLANVTQKSKGQRSRSQLQRNRHGHMVASDAGCYGRCRRASACQYDCLCFLVITVLNRHLHCTAVCLDVDDVSRFHFLLLKAFIDRWIQLQLFSTLCRLQADNYMRYCFAISCQHTTAIISFSLSLSVQYKEFIHMGNQVQNKTKSVRQIKHVGQYSSADNLQPTRWH